MSRSRSQPPKTVANQHPEKPLGRPPASPNIKSEAQAQPSRCKKCGSTERSKYFGVAEVQEFNGLNDGEPYTHIVRRRCTCKSCGQNRFDKSFENRR